MHTINVQIQVTSEQLVQLLSGQGISMADVATRTKPSKSPRATKGVTPEPLTTQQRAKLFRGNGDTSGKRGRPSLFNVEGLAHIWSEHKRGVPGYSLAKQLGVHPSIVHRAITSIKKAKTT